MTMGRPRKEFDAKDWKLLDVACQYKHPEEDIAALLDCCVDTLCARIREQYDCTFSEYRAKKLSKTKHNLFAKQMELAMEGKGNPTMLIWLGKQYLKQSDKNEVQNTVAIESYEDYLKRKQTEEII